jgi:nickel/cobalt transporter (NicO) family protein
MDAWLFALVAAAATVGSLHALAPDHWVPFAALGRARGWTAARTARLTFICGLGHVSVSAAFGITALIIGLKSVQALGATLQGNAALLLIGFGFAYMTWGLWRRFSQRLGHDHHHVGSKSGLTEWSLFLFFCADPCVAVIPMIIAASTHGWVAVATIIIVYEISMFITMLALVTTSLAGVQRLKFHWLDDYGDAVAGATIVVLGVVVTILGV